MRIANRTILLAACTFSLGGLASNLALGEEPGVRLARRQMVAIQSRGDAPIPLPPVTVPDPVGSGSVEKTQAAASALTLADLQNLAQQHNPTLAQAQSAIRAAQGRYLQAGLYPNPEVGYSGEEIGSEGKSGLQGSVVSQEIVTGGKLQLAQSAAGHGVAAARFGLETQRWRVLNAVRSRFYEVLLAQEMVSINRDLVRVGKEGVEVTTRLREAQEVGKAEVLQAKIEAERAKVSLFMAQNRHRTAWYQLAAVVGCPEMESAPLAGDLIRDLPTVTWDEGLARLLSGSPELAEARSKIRQARCKVALECAERRGNLSVEAGVKFDGAAEETVADAGVSIPLMIYDRNQGNIVAAQAELVTASREVDRLELELFNRFAESFEGYSNANRQVQLFRANVLDNARESLELIGSGYRQGEFDYLQLLTAQRTYFSANLEYLQALRELWERAVELDGLMLTGGLKGEE